MTDLKLNDGRAMAQFGLGTYRVPDSQAAAVVRRAIDAGVRLVDTAAIYRNERGVGEGLARTEAFVTTKLWNDRHDDPAAALDESVALLGRESVDLYLIHWPRPREGQFVEVWKRLIDLRAAGKTRSIGVSNFLVEHIEAIGAATGVWPAVNQVELHPIWQQRELRAFHERHGIVTQSWGPLGEGQVLDLPEVTGIAARRGVSPARVVIAWHLAHGLSVIPKAADPDHLADNLAAADLTLSAEEIAAIDALDRPDGRTGPDPRDS